MRTVLPDQECVGLTDLSFLLFCGANHVNSEHSFGGGMKIRTEQSLWFASIPEWTVILFEGASPRRSIWANGTVALISKNYQNWQSLAPTDPDSPISQTRWYHGFESTTSKQVVTSRILSRPHSANTYIYISTNWPDKYRPTEMFGENYHPAVRYYGI